MKISRHILAGSILSLFLAGPAGLAATKTHNGTGSLSGSSNWSPSGTPTTTDEALITGTPSAAITTAQGTNLTFGDFIFNSNVASTLGPNSSGSINTNWTLSGGGGSTAAIANGGATGDLLVIGTSATSNTVTLIDNAGAGSGKMRLTLGAVGNINVVNSGATLSASLVVDGTNGLTKTGAGTLILQNANTYTGTTTLSAGTLGLGSNSALNGTALTINGGSLASSGSPRTITSNVTVGGNFTLGGLGQSLTNNGTTNLGGATRTITLANSATFGGVVSNGGLTLASNNAARSLSLTAAATYTSGTTINGGILALSGAGALADAGAVNVNSNTATFSLSAITATGETIGSLAGASGSSVVLGAKNLTTGGNDTSTTFAGAISGTGGSLTKQGTGTMALTSANSFSGATVVSAGTLEAGAAGALGNTSGITVNSGGTLLLSGSGDRISDTAPFTLAGGTFNTAGLSETVGALTLSANSIIDLGAGSSILTFANSSASSWGAFRLSIYNWTGNTTIGGGTDQLRFTGNGLTLAQLSQIDFYSGTTPGTKLSITPTFPSNAFVGALGEVVPVPEPSGVFIALGLFGLAGWRERGKAMRLRAAKRRVSA